MTKKENNSSSASNPRRDFIKSSALGIGSLVFGTTSVLSAKSEGTETNLKVKGNQRLSLKKLKLWESLGYGMFLHFGMSTFDGEELSKGDKPSTFYAPLKVDTDQRIRSALTGAVLSALWMSVGIVMPMVLKGSGLFSHAPDLMSKAGIFISIGILIIVAGIILVSLAGFEREKVLNSKW